MMNVGVDRQEAAGLLARESKDSTKLNPDLDIGRFLCPKQGHAADAGKADQVRGPFGVG